MSKVDPELQKRADTKKTTGLPTEAAYWMTPSVSNSQGNEYTRERGEAGKERLTLAGQAMAAKDWPTPSAALMNDGESPESWKARAASIKAKGINGNGAGMPLTIAVKDWPTPVASDCGLKVTENSNQAGLIGAAYLFSRPGQPLPSGNGSSKHRLGSRPRLNPGFAGWLMGWPWWWTNPGVTSFAKSEMALYRYRLQLHLSCLVGAPGSSKA